VGGGGGQGNDEVPSQQPTGWSAWRTPEEWAQKGIRTPLLDDAAKMNWRRKWDPEGKVGEAWVYAWRPSSESGPWSNWQTQLEWAKQGYRTPRVSGPRANPYLDLPDVPHGLTGGELEPAGGGLSSTAVPALGITTSTPPTSTADPAEDLGQKAHDLIFSSPVGALVDPTPKAPGNVHVYEPLVHEAITVLYEEQGRTGTPSDIRAAAESNALTGGYADRTRGKARINKKLGDRGTFIHESIHLYSGRAFYQLGEQWPNEGATEYFTLEVCRKHAIPRGQNPYTEPEQAIRAMVACLDASGQNGQQLLGDAYFKGELNPLRDAMMKAGWDRRGYYPMDWWACLEKNDPTAAIKMIEEIGKPREDNKEAQIKEGISELIRFWQEPRERVPVTDIKVLIRELKKGSGSLDQVLGVIDALYPLNTLDDLKILIRDVYSKGS
jgi:hypothetical protein